MSDAVLLLTHTADFFTVDRVIEALRARGARAVRVDTDLFPTEINLAMSLDDRGWSHVIDTSGETLRVDDVRAVWARRVWAPRLDDDLDPEWREGCERESSTALRSFLAGFDKARWVDPPQLVTAAEDKPRQLRAARSVGMTIPRTLITNDPARVREFYSDLRAPMITKMLSALSVGMQRGVFVHTSLVTEGDLGDLDALRLCPMVFQELVPKRIELRVAVVGDRLFAGAIDASQSAEGRVDWRLAKPGEAHWERWTLSDAVSDQLRSLTASLGLRYGAIDLIVRPDGEHVFLEINPSGEWGMLERDLGLPIGAALADVLLDGP